MEIRAYKLKYPVELGSGEKMQLLSEVELRSPRAKELKLLRDPARGNEIDRELSLMAACTGTSIAQLEQLEAVDFYALERMLFDFLGNAAIAAAESLGKMSAGK